MSRIAEREAVITGDLSMEGLVKLEAVMVGICQSIVTYVKGKK